MMTGVIYHDLFGRHLEGYSHVESPQRYRAVMERLRSCSCAGSIRFIESIPAEREWIEAIHDKSYVDSILSLEPQGHQLLDAGDTVATSDTVQAALYSAGAGILGCRMVLDGELSNAFSTGRPPGHHAERNRAMGFCVFNNIAIAAAYLLGQGGLDRVAIIDWDVHHGNGTENSFIDDDRVLYVSIHQYPHYPGTGHEDDRGTGKGKGYTLNLPVGYGSDDTDYLRLFSEKVIPALRRHAPEFILISAGFDAHGDDPLSGVRLSSGAYREMTFMTRKVADEYAGGRIVSFLEGGYDTDALSRSVEEHVRALVIDTADNRRGSR